MRCLQDAIERWQVTTEHAKTLGGLKASVRIHDNDSPCRSGLRSVCWKASTRRRSDNFSTWPSTLSDSREAYAALRSHFLKFLEHPEELGAAADPLDDAQHSPWNALRKDEELRAEIYQDIERCMPENDYFRHPTTQKLMLDVLFVFCKINQDTGYRQGMHELLAPLLWVIEQDAIEIKEGHEAEKTDFAPVVHMKLLDQRYIEHDAFTLFALLMRSAKQFYELGELDQLSDSLSTTTSHQQQASPIVERSQRLHEVYLTQLDPELASHMTDIEILPQIFLIRWIRLLFGREFPLQDLLSLWDMILAEDPGLDLVDMICIAMLLRIRWQLIEANYSTALMLLLKYPEPKPPHDPQSFVDDAIFLRDNFNTAGGAQVIQKYSGKSPLISPVRPGTPSNRSISPSHRFRVRSPIMSPARFLQQQGGVEALIQGAARGVYDRGERLGINQAVRDAVGEVKKNIEGLQTPRSSPLRRNDDAPRWSLDHGKSLPSVKSYMRASKLRNQRLAQMLDQVVAELQVVATTGGEDQERCVMSMKSAMSTVEFVKACLADSTIDVSDDASPFIRGQSLFKEHAETITTSMEESAPISPRVMVSSPTMIPHQSLEKSDQDLSESNAPELISQQTAEATRSGNPEPSALMTGQEQAPSRRPEAPIPTRSSIAQSSFAWMLDEPSSQVSLSCSPPTSPFARHSKKASGPFRERTAFLFGEEGEVQQSPQTKAQNLHPDVDAADVFKLRTVRSGKEASHVGE